MLCQVILAERKELKLENGSHYLPLISAEFFSHKIDMSNAINRIAVSC